MKKLSLPELGILEQTLTKTPFKRIDVPKELRIRDWPPVAAPATLRLGTREYLYPELLKTTGFLRLEKKTNDIEITIHQNGAFTFSFTGTSAPKHSFSEDVNPIERIRALLLFHQFKTEICEGFTTAILKEVDAHNEAVEYIEQALETFVPFLLADTLTSWGE